MKKFLIAAAGGAVLAGGAFLAYAWRSPIAPVNPPSPTAFSPEDVRRGEALAAVGFCGSCHTRTGGEALAGGFAIKSPLGLIYATNITPDPETGIGSYSYDAFERAFRQGVRRDGALLYPAFPYNHMTLTTDEDTKALYAYLMTRAPVKYTPPANTLPFPFTVRLLMAGWNLFSFTYERYAVDRSKSEEWNRGAYLAEGLAHCGACHTPRNLLMAEKSSEPYAGAMIEDWRAPALTAANPSPAAWTADDLYAYLKNGASAAHGVAGGSMSEVTVSLARVPDADLRAIAVYFADLATQNGSGAPKNSGEAVSRALEHDKIEADANASADAQLFLNACAGCHYNGGHINDKRPDMGLVTSLYLDEPNNFILAVLNGINAESGRPKVVMPAFMFGLTDSDIARLANYLRKRAAGKPEWSNVESTVKKLRAKISAEPRPVPKAIFAGEARKTSN